MLDKNIAALLRDNARTVYVSFDRILIPTSQDTDSDGDDFMDDLANEPPDISPSQVRIGNRQVYTYVTTLELKPKDFVVVPVNRGGGTGDTAELAIAQVIKVDSECKIKPESKTKFKWVISKLDFARFYEEAAENQKIEAVVDEAYKKSLRTSFRDRLLANITGDDRALLEGVLRPAGTILQNVSKPATDAAGEVE